MFNVTQLREYIFFMVQKIFLGDLFVCYCCADNGLLVGLSFFLEESFCRIYFCIRFAALHLLYSTALGVVKFLAFFSFTVPGIVQYLV
jgi:hypothetical protein